MDHDVKRVRVFKKSAIMLLNSRFTNKL